MRDKSFVCIPMYHYVRDYGTALYKNIKGMDVESFRQQIAFFARNFNVISMEELFGRVETGEELPDRSLLLTFDDGYIDNYLYVYPVLKEFGVQGSFFVPGRILVEHVLLDVNKIHYILASQDINTVINDLKKKIEQHRKDFDYPCFDDLYREYAKPGRWDVKDVVFVKKILQTVLPYQARNTIAGELYNEYIDISEAEMAKKTYVTKEQVAILKQNGMHIGVHGFNHEWLENVESDTMKDDIDKALDTLGDYINKSSWSICYPKGSYSDELVKYCTQKGAKVGFSADYGVFATGKDDAMRIPRLDCNFFPPISERYCDYIL